ncbi:hypothetical protein [Streptomyces sp. NPDC001876]|uniref:hypothetical protein n=1 Tax=Streptomyces sp. NPDC001876 TaxID=3154402 RepID=UPI003316F16C
MTRFDEVDASFWNRDDQGVQPPLTEEMVQDARRLLGVRLPPSGDIDIDIDAVRHRSC